MILRILDALDTEKENIAKRIEQISKQQNEAIEQDKFELADELEVVLNGLKETVNKLIIFPNNLLV
jgi:hypothetical protein